MIVEKIYEELKLKGESVYLDDRDIRIGKKLNESDILGISNKILIGNKVENGVYEVKSRSNESWKEVFE
jgi:prolyl-tRNA synthetase